MSLPKQILLSFGNKARQGKDSAANGIKDWCERHSLPVMHVNLADALKAEVTEAVLAAGSVEDLLIKGAAPGVSIPSWVKPTPDAPSDPMNPLGKHVKLLQWWGTEYRRAQDPKYWIDKRREKVIGFEGVVVTADNRYTNENIDTLELGGFNVNVRRLNEDGTQFFDSSRPAGHTSEIDLDTWNWDYRIITKTGENALVKMQAVQILKYVMKLKGWRR
jgi:hypothetical protein